MLLPTDISSRLTADYVLSLPEQDRIEILELLEERQHILNTTKLYQLYPDTGPLRRELYPKHCAFFTAGKTHMERAAIAANRTGKTWGIGGYETTLHLTGEYPEWWNGRVFDHPVDVWAAGDTTETTRDIVQAALMGPMGDVGTGLIPAQNIKTWTPRRGVSDAMDTVKIKHKSGGVSNLGFKAFDQGRRKFQGTAKHVIWLDEEPPEDVYDECIIRLMTLNGIMLGTFTPLQGVSKIVMRYINDLAHDTE